MGPLSIGGALMIFRMFFEGFAVVFHASRYVAPRKSCTSLEEYFEYLNTFPR